MSDKKDMVGHLYAGNIHRETEHHGARFDGAVEQAHADASRRTKVSDLREQVVEAMAEYLVCHEASDLDRAADAAIRAVVEDLEVLAPAIELAVAHAHVNGKLSTEEVRRIRAFLSRKKS